MDLLFFTFLVFKNRLHCLNAYLTCFSSSKKIYINIKILPQNYKISIKQKRNNHKKNIQKKFFSLERHLRHGPRITYAATAKNSFYTFPFYGLAEKPYICR